MPNHFTAAEDAAIRILRAAGMSIPAIARGLDRSKLSIAKQVKYFAELTEPLPPPPVRRACLRCGDMFDSPHCGVRMCDPCKRRDNSPFEADW